MTKRILCALVLTSTWPVAADDTVSTEFIIATEMVGHALTISGIGDGVWTADSDLELVVDQERKTITLRSSDTAWECRHEAHRPGDSGVTPKAEPSNSPK